jgi:membrane protease YdiL (CAAX protease family)
VDFYKVGKGFFVSDDILSQAEIIFYLPFFMSLLLKNYLYPKSIVTAKEVFGYPVQFLPNSYKEYFIFCLYIITGVVYEELLCRQFAFRAFNETLHLRGDTLLIITAAIFAIGHLYQGWKGLLSSFILGLVLGKFFQMKENILYPIVLHLIFNMTILSLSYRRLKDLCKTG